MSKKVTSGRTSAFIFYGIFVGLCLGLFVKNYRALELVKRCSTVPNINDKSPFDIINMQPDEMVETSSKNLLFVGVMTAKNFLQGRAKAVYDTWGKEVPGRIAFFSSEGSYAAGLPVVALKGVDDRYPPQKKSFMMLYYMYEHFLDKFEWFVRADDDVYIHTAKLERFLRSIDSSKPQFIGQAGKGNSEEFGLLSLEFDENFCMGGPGVILSRETLRRVAPHIPTCLKNLYSTHEDVEIGRCVQKFAGIPCTWNYEMQSILHHNSSGKYAFTGSLKTKEVHSAITLHPVKKAPLMYRLHAYIQGLRAQEMRQETLALHRDISQMKEYLQIASENRFLAPGVRIFPEDVASDRYLGDSDILGIRPDLNKHRPLSTDDIYEWNFLARSSYSSEQSNPKKKIESSVKEGLEDVISEIMENINNFSRQRGRVIEFRELLYGYSRVNPLYGHDLIMDLLLIYKKYRGKKMTVPVRRHLYIQRAFTEIFVREMSGPGDVFTNATTDRLTMLSSKVKDLFNSGLGKISGTYADRGGFFNKVSPNKEKIVFVLSLAGRYETFLRFMQNYEEICMRRQQNTELLVVLFETKSDVPSFHRLFEELRAKYSHQVLNLITLPGNFSRGIALDTATRSHYIDDDAIILFIDVDMLFSEESLDRVRQNTLKHKQAYLPIVFSEYDPKRTRSDYVDVTTATSASYNDYYKVYKAHAKNEVSYQTGYFRQFGYGICAIYKSDALNPVIDGFNTDISGWGLEDVKFLEKIIKINNQPNTLLTDDNFPTLESFVQNKTDVLGPVLRRLEVFRAPDPSLIHVFHEIFCDRNLEDSQYAMCLGTKANTLGSFRHIESIFINNRTIIDFISKINKIV